MCLPGHSAPPQSGKHSAAHLAARVEAFVGQLLSRLEDIPEVTGGDEGRREEWG